MELAVCRAAADVIADRIDGIDQLGSESLTRPDTPRPGVVSAAANIATFHKIYTFDFDAARRMQDWAATFHLRMRGQFPLVYGHCFAGIAANEQLDVAAAEDHFRTALRVAKKSLGSRSYAARLAGALLGDLLYERGLITEAELLLDESYELGSEGGTVDFLLATYGIGSRIKALRGDRGAAAQRLDEGARIAQAMLLPRLRARNRERADQIGSPDETRPTNSSSLGRGSACH
ncbi:hypothetical protein FXW78_49875 [Rhodococcus opacus]|nr:hypothetical protein [Rhodococcus opacus]